MNGPIQHRSRRQAGPGDTARARRALLAVALLTAAVPMTTICGDEETLGDLDPEPDAGSLLQSVRAQFPGQAFTVTGQLRTYPTATRSASRRPVEIRFELGRRPAPRAIYTVRDAFGSATARLTVERPAGQTASFQIEQGDPLAPVADLDMHATIGDTDLSWMDLSMSYLWWRDGEIIGHDSVKGQHCAVVDVRPPAGERGTYASARLWIGTELPVLLRAEGFDTEGRRVRRMSVRSFKKLNGQWMIKDLDIARADGRGRTRLVIDDLQMDAAAQ